MADYYPLLVRAISGLPQNTSETRRIVFDRARAALLKQLRGVEPPLPEGEILRERQALEEAIRRISSEFSAQEPSAPAAAEPPSDPKPAGDAAESATIRKALSAKAGAAKTDARPTLAGQPPVPEADGPKPDSKAGPEKTEPSEEAPKPPAAAEAANGDPTAETPDGAGSTERPVLARGKVAGRDARPRLPKERHGEKKSRLPRALVLGALVLLVAGGGAVAYLKRDVIAARLAPAPGPAVTAEAPSSAPEPPKSEDRLTQAAGTDASRRPPSAGQRPPSASQRALLLEETPGATQGLQSYEGTVTWRTETFNAGPGLPPDVGIRAEIQIPERRMGVTFTLRRNSDQALPASHTVEIGFALPPDFAYGGISNVPGIRMKQTEAAQGAPLAGLSVRVNPTYFLVGLSAVATDRQRNLQLLQSRPWIDIPIVYDNGKRAIIAFEKGAAGEQAFQDAFSAWGELIPAPPPPSAPLPAPDPAN